MNIAVAGTGCVGRIKQTRLYVDRIIKLNDFLLKQSANKHLPS